MWDPETDCKYFNQCGKCLKVSSCSTVGSISAVDAKEFYNLKKERKCFMCADSACCRFAQECCIPPHSYNVKSK